MKRSLSSPIASLVIGLFLSASPALCLGEPDGAPITYGTYRTLHSKVLGEDRTILVRLPDDYATSHKKYPVLYKLDGEKDVFLQASSVVTYLAEMAEKAPDHIVIGIANTDRSRDMQVDVGGANFVQFLKAELIPFVTQNYRTNGFDVLCGQSLSAIFAVYVFLREPDLFDGYVMSSFAIYNSAVSAQLDKALHKADLRNLGRRFLFVGNGTLDPYDTDGSKTRFGAQFLDSLKRAAPSTVLIKVQSYDGEGHVPFPTVYDALRWIHSEETSLQSTHERQ